MPRGAARAHGENGLHHLGCISAALVAVLSKHAPQERLVVREPKVAPTTGAVGLWVDIGTEAYFSNLRATQRA